MTQRDVTLSSADSLEGFPGVHLAVDVAVLTVTESSDTSTPELTVLLQRRPAGYRAGEWVLPGRFVRPRETLIDCARICLLEKLDLDGVKVRQLMILDNPDRDPRGWTMSVGHLATLPHWRAVASVSRAPGERQLVRVGETEIELPEGQPELPFEQRQILDRAIAYLRDRYSTRPDPRNFLPDQFTLSELQAVHDAVLGPYSLSRDAFRRTFEPYLEPTGELRRSGPGKPAVIYRKRTRPSRQPRRTQRPGDSQLAKA